MQHAARFILLPLLATAITGGVWAMEGPNEPIKAAEYKRSDTNFYPKGDVVKTHPSAIILAVGACQQTGDSYFFTPHKKAPKEMYLEVLSDWIEPITPPDMPASLGIAPDAMQIREPQGDVQVALPSAPASFVPATEGMSLPNGAVIKTGANGTAAVLFGGVNSARLIPNSEAAVQQTVTPQSRSTEVDLTVGGVFSKVGTQVGVKGDYEVHTSQGNASTQGGDFVTIISGSRTDVWIAQGTVTLVNPSETKAAGTATSDGVGPLKILRDPGIADPHQSVQADTETLTIIMNFIPLADQKLKALREKVAGGATLTDSEKSYLGRIKQVPSLIKLALVEPPAPSVKPLLSTPSLAPMPAFPVEPAPAEVLQPIAIDLRADGKVDFQGATLSLDELKADLEAMGKATPAQPLVIEGREKVTRDQLKKVRALCRDAKLTKIIVAKAKPLPAPATPVTPASNEPAANLPAPALRMNPSMEPTPPPAAPDASAPPTTNAPPAAGP